jgi:sugar phosphate permease
MSIAALAGVEQREAGLASGLINTSQQIGGALGVAVAATIAFTHTTSLLKAGESQASAATSGFALAFWVLAGVSAAAVVTTLLLVRPVPEAAVEAEAAEAVV